jgi:heat shock protein HtpX
MLYVMNSVLRAWTFLAILSLTLIVLGHSYGGREGLLFALILVLGINSYVYFYEDRRILSLFSGKELEGQDSYGLYEMARRLAIKSRIPTPRIVLVPSLSPQAGVVGRGITNGAIILTQGCLDRFSRTELEAILAYQIACIRTLNTLAFAVGSFIVSVSLFIAGALDTGLRLLIVEKKDPNTMVSQFFTRLASPILGLILKISIRPSFYQAADQLTVQLISNPHVLAKALWKLDAYAQTLPFHAPLSAAHIFIVSPLAKNDWTRHFIAQPKSAQRIRDLIGYYPI